MTNEIRLAFAHPSERSEASSTKVLDRISLRDHVVEVEIGAFQTERGTTQRICFNVVVEVKPASQTTDDVDRILSYDKVTDAISYELELERLNLLETLADRVAERILLEPQAVRVFVRIEKLDRGPGALGVEIVRDRQDIEQLVEPDAADKLHPRLVYLSNSAIASEHLTGWLDSLSASHVPAILCVGLPLETAPGVANSAVARRISLLAIEQNAWVLAARDSRCVVVASKTELDWSIKNGMISVWAPSKMVLDATHPPQAATSDGVGLAKWLAEILEVQDMVFVGEEFLEEIHSEGRVQAIEPSLLQSLK
ncbi:MAG: diguanylate cyclase [Marinovum sp.]|nr:diguanylate cyclase [Marinovum sp.]MBT7906907.1 diguanylate cyclase [Marinovum sp.]